ncbi:MAG: aspartate carbamoyltransferase catalytic subunit [Candidatus Delongbacteria bacterium]|nr:aspartate carbamoyltransferase catalytic subunit [Candidatus Delongbacteria bacterium]
MDNIQTNELLKIKHLLGIKGMCRDDLELILKTSASFKQILDTPNKKVAALKGVTVVNMFFENSTRTKLSFEMAEKRLSADVINFAASSSSLKKGETLIDTAKNIEAMKIDMVVMRHSTPGAHKMLLDNLDSIIINAGDGAHEHPTQAILDLMTIDERIPDLKGKRVTLVGDIIHSRVAMSNIHALQLYGAKVQLCGPATLIPKSIEKLGVEVTYDLEEAIKNSDVMNILRIQLERHVGPSFPSLREYHNFWGITNEKLAKAKNDILILHPGPMNRGVEIDDDVADGDHQVILDQVLNGVASRMAILYLLSANIGGIK